MLFPPAIFRVMHECINNKKLEFSAKMYLRNIYHRLLYFRILIKLPQLIVGCEANYCSLHIFRNEIFHSFEKLLDTLQENLSFNLQSFSSKEGSITVQTVGLDCLPTIVQKPLNMGIISFSENMLLQ